jgi:signal transduction histidine kinase
VDNTPRVLIIDDEEVVLDSCTQILQGRNYSLATAPDGERGLEQVRQIGPDVVFVDLKMPGLPGLDVLEKIREIDPTIVTIVITGFATVSSAVDAMKRGAYDFLPKPFTPDEFRLITQRGLEKRKLVLETIALRREKELLKEHFAAIVSHELKAPLGAVQQNLYALIQETEGRLTAPQSERMQRMRGSIDALLKLIHTWLRLYTTDVEGIAQAFQPLTVADVVTKAVESVQPHAVRKDVEISPVVEDGLPQVLGDEGTLVEAVVNLLGNAVKFSRPGSRVVVRAGLQGNGVALSVEDTGVGIAREDLPLVFEGFFVGRSRQTDERGSGLGLAITRRIVEAHRGVITVESELGKGSTFLIRLPALGQSRPEVDPGLQSRQGGNR